MIKADRRKKKEKKEEKKEVESSAHGHTLAISP